MAADSKIDLFVLQVDIALTRRHHHRRIEDELAKRHDSVLRREIRHRAVHIGLRLVIGQQQTERARNIDAHKFGEGTAYLTIGHDKRYRAIGGGRGLVNRIADAVKFRTRCGKAFKRRHPIHARHELFEAQPAEAHIDVADRHVLARIDLHIAVERSAREGERDRRQLQDAIFQRHFGFRGTQRKIARGDGIGAVMHVRVHLAQPFDAERRVRQDPAAGDDRFGRRRALRCVLRTRADQRSKVIEIELVRCDIAGEIGALAGSIDGKLAAQIALADLAGEIGDSPIVDIARQIAR